MEVSDPDNENVTLFFEGPEEFNITGSGNFSHTYSWTPQTDDPINVR